MLGALGIALLAAGPPVVSVTVEGAASDVSRYLAIARGSPLDPAQARRTLELLHATGAYEDVVVEEADAPGGVAITVRVVPAPLLATVVVEGDSVISPDDVRDVSRLRRGEPLWPARLETAARDVAVELGRRGYLEARVTAAARREPDGAAALFTVASGPRVLVEAATVESADASLAAVLQRHVEPDAGEPFDRERAQEAAEAMTESLRERGRWRSAVELAESYDPAASRIRLLFRAAPGPGFDLRVVGSGIEDKVVDRVRALLRNGGAGNDAIEEGRDAIEAALRAAGHRKAVVTPSEAPSADGIDIVYAVEPGPRSIAATVSVLVPPGIDAAVRTRVGEAVTDAALAEDERALTRALEEAGHAGARVVAETTGDERTAVVFRAQASQAVRVGVVEVVAPHTLPVLPAMQSVPGAPYRLRDVASDRMALAAAYRNEGYLAVEVAPQIAIADGEARVRLVVAPGPRTFVDRVVVAGLDQTREEVVRREVRVREGEALGVDDMLETQRRLTSLGLFDAVTIVEIAGEAAGRRTLVIRVSEAPRTSVAYAIGYGERDLVRGSVEVTRRNLFGMDRRLSAFVRMSFRGSRFLASYREPHLFGRRQELFLTAFRDEEDREAFDYARYGVTAQTAWALAPRFNLVLRQTYQEIRTFNVVEDCLVLDRQFCPATLSGPSVSLVRDTRDDALEPRGGYFAFTDAQLSHRALGGDTLVKAFVQASTYRIVAARVVAAVAGRIGMARTFGREPELLPIPERFFAGGDYSLRGFGVDEVRPEGGNGVLLGTLELRVDTGGGFSVAAFTDAGNVYRLASDMSLSDLRYTAGVGLRYRSALGPLRLDWGFKLDRRANESASQVHVTIGHAF